jgi:hypothetical protein
MNVWFSWNSLLNYLIDGKVIFKKFFHLRQQMHGNCMVDIDC